MNTTPDILPVFEDLPGVRAFFTTRRGGVSLGGFSSLNLGPRSGEDPENVRRNWEILLESQGWSGYALALPGLCHGAASAEIAEAPGPRTAPGLPDLEPADADAVYTRRPGWVLAVTMADCLPALLADPATGWIGAVHAGWRGTRDGVLEKTLRALFDAGKCRPDSTRVALGPCLSAPALELSADIAATLPREHVRRENDRCYVDLRAANRAQAIRAGVREDGISEKGGCTHGNPEAFFSWRRDGGITGRMAACIALA
jgi:YfiH family protein